VVVLQKESYAPICPYMALPSIRDYGQMDRKQSNVGGRFFSGKKNYPYKPPLKKPPLKNTLKNHP